MDANVVEAATNIVAEGWWVQALGAAATILFAVMLFGARKFTNWIMAKVLLNEAEQESMQCLLEGMAEAQDDIVREAKAASSDGKLTKEEIAAAGTLALRHAREVAMGPAKDIVCSWSSRRASSLIKQLLSKVKGKITKVEGVTNVGDTSDTGDSVSTDS